MMSPRQKENASFAIPDYSRTRIYKGTRGALAQTGFASIADLVSTMNRLLIDSGKLPVSCGDYPTSDKKLARLVKRWQSISTSSQPFTCAA
jgi:hypothetical protein